MKRNKLKLRKRFIAVMLVITMMASVMVRFIPTVNAAVPNINID